MKIFLLVTMSLMLTAGVAALAQISSTLKQQYGSPDSQGLYRVRPEIGLEAIFAQDGRPKAMTIKPMPTKSANKTDAPKLMPRNTAFEVLDEVVPVTRRGKKGSSYSAEYGCTSSDRTEYENVTIAILNRCERQGGGTYSINIRWKK